MKKEGVVGAKDLLNILWGGLCESNFYKYNVEGDQEIHINDADIKHISSDSKVRIKCLYYDVKQYKTNYARIKPFILAYGRKQLMKGYIKYESRIIRIHTDGFYLAEQPDDISTGDKLGYLKYEGPKQVNITRLNKLK